jgi:hypothetical protein
MYRDRFELSILVSSCACLGTHGLCDSPSGPDLVKKCCNQTATSSSSSSSYWASNDRALETAELILRQWILHTQSMTPLTGYRPSALSKNQCKLSFDVSTTVFDASSHQKRNMKAEHFALTARLQRIHFFQARRLSLYTVFNWLFVSLNDAV